MNLDSTLECALESALEYHNTHCSLNNCPLLDNLRLIWHTRPDTVNNPDKLRGLFNLRSSPLHIAGLLTTTPLIACLLFLSTLLGKSFHNEQALSMSSRLVPGIHI